MSARARRRHRRSGRKRNPFLLAMVVLGACLALAVLSFGVFVLAIAAETPPLAELHQINAGANSVVYAADGSRLGFIQSDTARTPVELDQIPADLQHATVAIEDNRFYEHGGVDLEGIVRAAYNNVSAGETKEGGSTITQQLARNLYIADPKRDIERKIREAKIAEEIEGAHSKDWILNQYLNTASYGTIEGRTSIGVEAASQIYFSKPVKDLDLAESALLAGLPQSPSAYNPILDPGAALDRRNEVLDAMADQGYISKTTAEETKQQAIKLHPGTQYSQIREPYIFDYVEQQLIDQYGVNTVRNGGLKVYTTIDPRLQAAAQHAVDSCSVCFSGGGPASALASVNPSNGEIVAIASSQRYSQDSQFNFATHAQRQPGSSFKAYDLTAAIKQGVNPDTTYYDGTSPAKLDPGDGTTWEVNNAEPGGGVVPLTQATWESVNVVFAKLSLDVGIESIAETAYDMGITSPLGIKDDGQPCKGGTGCFIPPADAIGGLSVGVTPLEQADAYATLANGGVHHDPTAVNKVVFPDGTVDEPSASEGKRVLTPGQAYSVTKVLEGVITSGTGAGYTSIGCGGEAGKTGTSEDLSDAWFVGYTPLYSTAVWTGHPLSRESTGFGGPTSGPIWRSFMQAAQGDNCPEFPVPEDLPELTAFHGSHTSSSSSSSCTTDALTNSGTGSNCAADTPAPVISKDKNGGGSGSYAPGKGQKPAPAPKPAPTPTPTPTPTPPPTDPGSGGITP